MSLLPLNTNKMLLESSVTRVFNNYHRLAYAQIGSDLTILQTSDNFSFLLPEGIETAEGRILTEIMEEFTGVEDSLQAVLAKAQEDFVLDYVNRELSDGSSLYLNFRVVNLHTLCATNGLLLIVEDVTELGTLERQLVQHRNDLRLTQSKLSVADAELKQLNQFKSFLLSMLAHDMRTPLAAIRGYSELLVRLINSNRIEMFLNKATAFADTICHITDQMTWLIKDIIDLDQSEKGLLTTSQESCDVHQVIHDTIEMLDSIIKLQHITLILELNPPDLLISADSQRMRQITNNLIGNAIKCTPSGGQITIKTLVENGNAIVAVADNGLGMTPEQTEKIFQPYYRAKEAKTSNVLGSGLGLHIVKMLVEAQNGRIEAVSEAGKGSAFTVYLPLV